MRILLDRQRAAPLYRQIEDHLRRAIRDGGLAEGTRLPATRRLAASLGVNRATVESAYAELEADGLIASRAGSGWYVLPTFLLTTESNPSPVWPAWQSEAVARFAPPDGYRLGERLDEPSDGTISFETGLSDPRLFPAADLRRVVQAVTRRDGFRALGYGDPRGYLPLRETIARVLASQGLRAHPESVLVTSGSQQALALVGQLLLRPDDVVAVERPTYAGALDLFRSLGVEVVGVPTDERGLVTDALAELLERRRVRLVYTVPTFGNPTGACLSGARRRELVALADRHDFAILEDDFVGDLRYEGHAQPPLKALDPGGRVIYVGTFSKMLTPGLRVGFLVAEGPIYASLVRRKLATDLTTSSLAQRALESYISVGSYGAHLRRSCGAYRKRRDAMLAAIGRHLPGASLEVPLGGLFVWLRLPEGVSAETLLPLARSRGVTFAPGGGFFPERADGDGFARLNFAARTVEEITEGVRRLGEAARRARR